jgi:hypothetical protein
VFHREKFFSAGHINRKDTVYLFRRLFLISVGQQILVVKFEILLLIGFCEKGVDGDHQNMS